MKSKHIITTVICSVIASAMLLSSCKKVLEQEPRNSTYGDVFWKTSGDYESAMAGNYALLRDVMTSGTYNPSPRYYMYGDAVSNSYLTLQYVGDGLEAIQNGDITGNYNLKSLANWTKYYKAIAMSNLILSKVETLSSDDLSDVSNPETFKKKIKGQALFIRALCYFMMTRVWGDVPLVTTVDDPLTAKQLARNPKAEVMKQIEADCHEAAQNLSWGYLNSGEANVTANKGSVYALLAHLYLWRATMLDITSSTPNLTDVNSADTTITSIMNSGGYSLNDTTNYYKTFIGRSTEGIFEIAASEDSKEGSSWSVANMFLRSDYIASNSDNSRAFVPPSYLSTHYSVEIEGPYDWVWNTVTGVWEWKATIVKTNDTKDIRFRKNFTDVSTDKPTCIKYNNVVYRNPGQKLDAYVSNNIVVFRLSDMKLLKAEIALYKNNPSAAVDILNEFRTRNGTSKPLLSNTLSKDAVMDEYILERGREMYLEGHIFYDLLRTRKYGNYVSWLTSSRFNQEGFYWPVDPALFSNNNQMVQTSYWRGKI
jgi:hypothetical protein